MHPRNFPKLLKSICCLFKLTYTYFDVTGTEKELHLFYYIFIGLGKAILYIGNQIVFPHLLRLLFVSGMWSDMWPAID